MPKTGNDRGALTLLTVARLAIPLAIVGIFGYDGFSVMSNRVSTENEAQNAAYAASSAWHNTNAPNVSLAYDAAVQSVAGTGDTVLTQGFSVDSDGTVHLLLRDDAHTLVISHIGPLKHFTVTTEHGDANSVN